MSKDLHQLDFIGKTAPNVEEVSIAQVRRRPTLARAIVLAQEVSGLEDKQVYDAIGIDASFWTRIKNGKASLPPQGNGLNRYMDVVRNEVPLIWLNESRGYDWSTIRKHRNDLERENERLRQELADRDRAIGLIISHQGRK
jgi:hypothetical protein